MKTIKFLALFLAIVAMASCQKENVEPSYMSDPTAVKFTATVGSPFTRSNPTDNDNSTTFNSGDVVAVAADAQAAVLYTLSGSAWSPESGKYLKWATNPMTFEAYYPVGVHSASMTTFTVPTDQSTLANIEQADYMTYTSPVPEAKAASVSLTLKRQMARVVITTEFNDQYATGYTLESITVSGNTNGYENSSPKSGDITVKPYKQDGKYYALLTPTTADAATTFLTITMKRNASGAKETLTVKGIPTQTAGMSYAYTVKVGKDEAKVGSVTVTDWTTGTPLPDGETDAVTKAYIDPTFAAELESEAPSVTLKEDNEGKYIDLADNAVMTAVKAVTTLSVREEQITSLKGIEHFTGLTYLNCSENNLTSLDVSKLTNLTSLFCNNNLLTSLDVSSLTKLEQLWCYNNNLTTLDISMFVFNPNSPFDLKCGNQNDNRELRLTMTMELYSTIWYFVKNSPFNNNVTPVDPSGNPFIDSSK